jgi:hypothetical protein
MKPSIITGSEEDVRIDPANTMDGDVLGEADEVD